MAEKIKMKQHALRADDGVEGVLLFGVFQSRPVPPGGGMLPA